MMHSEVHSIMQMHAGYRHRAAVESSGKRLGRIPMDLQPRTVHHRFLGGSDHGITLHELAYRAGR